MKIQVDEHVLRQAISEIRHLRAESNTLRAQMWVVDVFAHAVGLRPGPIGMGEDVAWRIEGLINDALQSVQKPGEDT